MTLPNLDFWEDLGPNYHLMSNDVDGQIERHRAVLTQLLGESRQLEILDLACGQGPHLVAAAKQGHLVTGIDLSPAMVKAARANLRRHGVKARVLVGDARKPPLPRGTLFNRVLIVGNTVGVISQPADITQIFLSARARLRENGRIVVSLRDHSAILPAVPGSRKTDGPSHCNDRYGARIVSQLWTFRATNIYDCTVRIKFLDARAPITCHFAGCRAWRWEEIASLLVASGFALRAVVIPASRDSVYTAGLDQIFVVADVAGKRA